MKMTPLFCAAVLTVLCTGALACGVKGPVVETRPIWRAAAAAPLPGSRLLFLTERGSDTLATVTFCNLGGRTVHFSFGWTAPSASAAAEDVVLKPGEQKKLETPVAHFLTTYFASLVNVWNVTEGAEPQEHVAGPLDVSFAPPPPPQIATPMQSPALRTMYSVYPLEDATAFNARLLAALLVRQPDGTALATFRNDAHRTVHFDFRVEGFQSADAKNPRIHLYPDMDAELPLTLENPADPNLEYALIEVFNIRVGSDTGTVVSPERPEAAPRRVAPCGAEPLFNNDYVELNNHTLCQITEPKTIRLLNVGTAPVSLDPFLAGINTVQCPRLTIPAGGEAALNRESVACRPGRAPRAFIRNLRVGADEGPFIGALDEPRVALQDGWLSPTVLGDTGAFNPKCIGYGIVASEGATTIKFVNFADTPVYFDFRLPGYQDENSGNTRVALGPQRPRETYSEALYSNREFSIRVKNADARLCVAKMQIFNIRSSAADLGPLTAAKPAPEQSTSKN